MQMTPVVELPGQTNVQYWEYAARHWDDIHDTFASDENGVIFRALRMHCRRNDFAVDFGCGGGRWLQPLAARCKQVLGLDISPGLLNIARRKVVERLNLSNVVLECADLGARMPNVRGLPKHAVDLAICANVLISPEPCTRANILSLIAASLRPGGTLVLLVPAVASALNIRETHKRWVRERRRRGLRPSKEEVAEATDANDDRRGIFRRVGVRTKHYRLVELQALLHEHGFHPIVSIERVEFSWDSEFERPTNFLDRDSRLRRPFDWLVVCRRETSDSAEATSAPSPSAASAVRQAPSLARSAETVVTALRGMPAAPTAHRPPPVAVLPRKAERPRMATAPAPSGGEGAPTGLRHLRGSFCTVQVLPSAC